MDVQTKHSELKDIVEFIIQRQQLGRERYGHGIRREDDTRAYGTKLDSWWEMAQEEVGDAINYAVCGLLRLRGVRSAKVNDDNAHVVQEILSQEDDIVRVLCEVWATLEAKKQKCLQ